MELWLWAVIVILICIVAFLIGKLYFLRRAAREIVQGLEERLSLETNTLIDLSSRDREMRRLAETVNRELRALRDERHRFQQGDSGLKEAVTNISHDLRTPLTSICGYLELLEREEKSEAAERYLAIIRERTRTMRELTEELLRYSVAKSTHYEIERETIAVNDVLEDSIAACYGVIAGRGIQPEITMPEAKVLRSLNRKALLRVFGNVLDNAARYSDGDLKITLSEEGEILFANHASGLDGLRTEQLFGRFYTVDSAQTSTGLGLAIAKLLTEEMGGRIGAEYREGVLEIRLAFPAQPGADT